MKYIKIFDFFTEEQKKEFGEMAIKLCTMAFGAFITSYYNIIAGNLFLTLSIGYLLWRWRRDWVKNKREAYLQVQQEKLVKLQELEKKIMKDGKN